MTAVDASCSAIVPGTLTVPMVEVDGEYRVAWTPSMAFPGLVEGETLERVYRCPRAAARSSPDD